jgi:CheY-like chemotaxis protein
VPVTRRDPHTPSHPITILVADGDQSSRAQTCDALQADPGVREVCFVADGQELMDHLRDGGARSSPETAHPRRQPSLILLDLDLPRKDGRVALAEIKSDARLRRIPVVVFTTAFATPDLRRLYELGAGSCIIKPDAVAERQTVLTDVTRYWSQVVTLPDPAAV